MDQDDSVAALWPTTLKTMARLYSTAVHSWGLCRHLEDVKRISIYRAHGHAALLVLPDFFARPSLCIHDTALVALLPRLPHPMPFFVEAFHEPRAHHIVQKLTLGVGVKC